MVPKDTNVASTSHPFVLGACWFSSSAPCSLSLWPGLRPGRLRPATGRQGCDWSLRPADYPQRG
eukprot:2864123-Alexandrium_andersonii.AAC.1